MIYHKLGNTDINVSMICLGTMTWGEQNTQPEAFEQMDYALEEGVNFFDTAELYPVPPDAKTYTHTETILGNWLKDRKTRHKIFLASKIAGRSEALNWIRKGKNKFDGKNLTEALEGSLKRLSTDYLDLYQLHWPNRKTNYFGKLGYVHKNDPDEILIEETLGVLNKFLKEGKIRHYGLSNDTAWGIMNCIKKSDELSMPHPVSVQNPYNLLNRSYEVNNAEVSMREQIGLLAYSPLGFGVLSGKYLDGKHPTGSRMDVFSGHFNRYNSNPSSSATSKYIKVARKYHLSPAQMALSFVNSRPFVTSTIIGATSLNQLKENINSIKIKLSDETIKAIDSIHAEISNPAP